VGVVFAPPKAKAPWGNAAIMAAEPTKPARLRKSRRTVDFIAVSPFEVHESFDMAEVGVVPGNRTVAESSSIHYVREYRAPVAGFAGKNPLIWGEQVNAKPAAGAASRRGDCAATALRRSDYGFGRIRLQSFRAVQDQG
jgi:hypothetical protein